MFAGRKLLVADDSSYYRTVISLTFSDEGMEVTTAVDSHEALEKVEQSTPDVILASVSMPGTGGYELCRLIKESQRFGHIPVMLLVGLHESFDQAEARRVGADDVVTKPFQSIRQLVNRVGSLLGGKAADAEETGHDYSTLGLGAAGADRPAADDRQIVPEPNVPVFVEAASMTEPESTAPVVEAGTSVADVALQTADTQKLERIDDEPAAIEPIAYAQDDTIEMEPAIESDEMLHSPPAAEPDEESLPSIGALEMNEKPSYQTVPLPTPAIFQDALLDLGDFDGATKLAVSEDLILDLDYEGPAAASAVAVAEAVPETVAAVEADAPAESVAQEPEYVGPEQAYAAPEPEYIAPEPEYVASEPEYIASEPAYEEPPVLVAEFQEWAIVSGVPAAEAMPATSVAEPQSAEPGLELSPEAIDAIARRVVEHLSDSVVREIAWEVVPELAELLIKKRLDEQQ